MLASLGPVSTATQSRLPLERNENADGFPRMILSCLPQLEGQGSKMVEGGNL